MNINNLFTKITLGLLLVIAGIQVSVAQNWQLVWSDEFTNGIGPDWNFEVNGNGGGNNELQYYRAENASVQNGNLVITAKQENFGGKNYTSARMTTQNKKSWKYGKMEARIAITNTQGLWPAFWMLGDQISSVGWPKCGEIDIFEHVNTGNTNYGTIHWNSDADTHVEYSGNTQVNDITQYHIYSVTWDANAITWYVDGVQFWQANIANGINSTSEFHANFFILLNLAVGGNWPGNSIGALPSTMMVDYVRVYQDGVIVAQPTTDVVTAYKDCNYSGFSGGLNIGDYNLAKLQSLGIQDNDVSSIQVAEGYKAILYMDDNFSGTSMELTANSACFNTTWNDKVSSIRVVANGATDVAGAYFLQNRNSGLFMDITGGEGATGDGARAQQWNTAATNNQLFDFTHLGNGLYKIIARHSGKALDVDAAKKDNGAIVQQWTSANSVNQQFIVYPTGDGFYKIIPRFSGKLVEVAGASTALEAKVQQWDNNNQTCGQWKFIGPNTGLVTAYRDCNYAGISSGFGIGEYTKYQMGLAGLREDDMTSLKVTPGYKAILYTDDNFGGSSIEITANSACFNSTWNDKISSMKVVPNGVTTMAGTYFLQNRNSALYMDVTGAGTADGTNIAQNSYTGATNQQFKLVHLGNGLYQVLAVHSNKTIDIDAIKTTDGANVQEWTYMGSANQKFIVFATGDGYYKLIPSHSGKIVEVAGASTAVGGNVQQWTDNGQTCGQWKFKPVVAAGTGTGLAGNYFNGMNFETPKVSRTDATINFDWGSSRPDASVNTDQFSARWTGQIQPKYSEEYTFYINSDNGRKLWVNNQLVIDKWLDDVIEYSGKITLVAGQKYDIRVEYFENAGTASCKLEWSSFMQDREVVPQTQLYPNALPTVSITAPANNATYVAAANINITASAADTDGSVAKVEFYNGTTLLGTATASPYTYSWTNVAVGTYTLTAVVTDNKGGVGVSGSITAKVNANQAPAVSVTATSPSPNSVTITATATDADGTITKVDYYDGATKVGTSTASPYTITLTGVTAGTHSITAVATDDKGGTTTSSAVSVVVANPNQAPTVSITAPANNATYVAAANITLTATAADADGSVAKVEFYNGVTLLGSATTSPYTYNWTNVAAGTYTITAKATDNQGLSTTSGAITVKVNANQAPSVSVTATSPSPNTVTITATATDADGTITKVDYYDGATKVGTSTASPYTITLTGVTAGTHSITAVATDDKGGTTTSSAVSVVVVNPNQAPTVSITAPANNATYVAAANITLTATAADADGSVAKVEFYNGATLLATVTTSPYTYSWTNVAAGTYTITAKATDNQGLSTTSGAITVKVNANQAPVVSVTATSPSPNTVTITATATDADGTIAKVDYYDGGTKVGTSITSPYTITLTGVTAGTHSITVVATDDKGGNATSSAVSVVVVNPNQAPTVSVTAPANNATYVAAADITLTATAADADGSVAKVEFYNGITLLATVTASPYTYNWENVAAGTYTITAKATDNQGLSTTSSAVTVKVNVNQEPVVNLTATSTAANTVSISATATDGDGSIVKVEYYDGNTKIGESTSSPYSFTWTNVPAGTHNITAVATDDKGGKTTSAVSTVNVEDPANQLPVVSITSPVNNATFASPATISITANASDADGTISKVMFYNGEELLGEVTTFPYTFEWTGVAQGSYTLTVVATDNKGATTTSAAVTVVVETTTAVNDPSLSQGIKLYPNPVQDILYFSAPVESVVVYDIAGSVLDVQNSAVEKLDLNSYATGIYILQYQFEGKNFFYRVVKK